MNELGYSHICTQKNSYTIEAEFMAKTIEIKVTPRNSLKKENNAILFWHNWLTNQLRNQTFYNIAMKNTFIKNGLKVS